MIKIKITLSIDHIRNRGNNAVKSKLFHKILTKEIDENQYEKVNPYSFWHSLLYTFIEDFRKYVLGELPNEFK